MNVQQIIDEVDLLVFNDQTPAQKVNKLNQISRQLFREFPLPDKVYKFSMTEIPYYDMPEDCSEDRIKVVIVNGVEYQKLSPEIQQVTGSFCTVLMEKLFVSPNKPDQEAYLYYLPRHVDLSTSSLYAVPTFPEDYHEILVYGLAQWVATIQRDMDLINAFQAEYNAIYNKAKIGLRKMGLKKVRLTTIW